MEDRLVTAQEIASIYKLSVVTVKKRLKSLNLINQNNIYELKSIHEYFVEEYHVNPNILTVSQICDLYNLTKTQVNTKIKESNIKAIGRTRSNSRLFDKNTIDKLISDWYKSLRAAEGNSGLITVIKLAKRYNVSKETIRVRLKNANILPVVTIMKVQFFDSPIACNALNEYCDQQISEYNNKNGITNPVYRHYIHHHFVNRSTKIA